MGDYYSIRQILRSPTAAPLFAAAADHDAMAEPPKKRARTSKGGKGEAKAAYWLVKMPPFVATDFQRRMAEHEQAVLAARKKGQPEPEPPVLGKMRVYESKPGESGFRGEVLAEVKSRSGAVKQHCLPTEIKKEASRLLVFSENNQCRIEGNASLVFDVKVQAGSSYKAVSRDRVLKYTAKTTGTQALPQNSIKLAMGPTSEVVERKVNAKRMRDSEASTSLVDQTQRFRRPTRPERELRVRADPAEVERLLLHLFEERDAYTAKELGELTNQTSAFLREMLAKMCDHHKSGELAHKYTLKEEYRIL